MSVNDQELLRQYAEQTSQDAFAQLVARHLDLVYSAACRQVRSPQLAEEVSQSVFADLAKTAGSLKSGTLLPAWLYQVTRRTAIDVVRRESRRQARERLAVEMAAMNHTTDWTHIEPLLDEAMASLEETDRAAILLRYFKNQSLREVGLTLGTSEDAAQKRVGRAVERLRAFFARRGVTLGAGGIAAAVSANAIQAAPGGLAAAISATAALAVAQTSTTIAITKTIAMTTLQKTCLAAALAATIGTGLFQTLQNSRLREQLRHLHQDNSSLNDRLAQLQRERDEAAKRLALVAEAAKKSTSDAELLKLRSEVTRLQANGNSEGLDPAMKSLVDRVALLKQKLAHMPDKKIPELAFLTEKDWVTAAWGADLTTDDGVRLALSKLREEAINTFLNEMMKTAMKGYLAAHGDILPPDLYQLKPYFSEPVTDDMLQRYQLLQSGKPDNSADLVKLVSYADEDYDSTHAMSINGAWGSGFNKVQQEVQTAAAMYAYNNSGQFPTDPSQLTSYLAKPVDAVTVQKYLDQFAANPPSAGLISLAPAIKAYLDANNGMPLQEPAQLQPYVTTPTQQAALQKIIQTENAKK